MGSDSTIAVIGGGVSGIAAAHFLKQAGLEVELLERSEHLGGRIGSCRLGDRWLDFGGKNIGRRYHLFRRFTESLGEFRWEYFGINSSQVRDGRIVTFDSSRRWRTVARLLRRCRPSDLIRFGHLCWRARSSEENGYLGSAFFGALGQRLDDRPASDFFGAEFCRRMLRPMTVRMNGAEPDEVYMGNLGTNIRMIFDSYEQLEVGMKQLLDRFAATTRVRLGVRVDGLVERSGRVVGVRATDSSGATRERAYAGVVLATQAPEAARLLEPAAPELAELLGQVRYYPVAVALARYRRDVFSPEVRALVFDQGEVLSNAGSYGINDLDLVRYTFSGRRARRFLARESEPEAWLRRGEELLGRYLPVDPSERIEFVARRFDRGLCAYVPHYERFSSGLTEQLRALPGLFLTGDYLRGASIEACFRASQSCASRIVADVAEADNGAGVD